MSPERELDVTLAQYAAVLVALAEGHELARVLAHEGIVPALWPDAEEAWTDRLAQEGGVGSRLQAELDEHLAAAQDRYARGLPPIDDDLRAFLDFRRRWSTDANPPALLTRLGLRLGEVARLSRRWSTRLDADPALAEEAQRIMREEPGELPEVTPVAVELPSAPPAPEGEAAAPPEDDEDERTVVDELPPFAAVSSDGAEDELGERPQEGAEAPATGDIAEPLAAAPARRQRPSFLLTKEFTALGASALMPFKPGAPALPRSPASLAATSAFVAPIRAQALPFSKKDVPRKAPEPLPAPREALTGTASFEGLSFAAVLPFMANHGTEPMPAVGTHSPTPFAMTAAVSTVATGPALPFEPKAEPRRKLSVGQYAAFCAELSAFPQEMAQTFQRYGLTSPEDGVELASSWQERFEQAPADFDTWRRLHTFFLEHCRTKGRPEVKL